MNIRSIAILSLLACAGVAMAQPPSPAQSDPLRGPEVRDRQVPGVNGSFGEPGGDKKRFVNENRLPPRVFRDAMQTIMSPDAPENLRLTEEQRTRYHGWMDDFQKTVGEYMKQHREELGELRRKAGENGPRRANGGGGDGGGQGDQPRPAMNPDEMKAPMDEKEVASARERLQSLMAGAPKIEDLYTRIWTELKPDQQKAVDEKIAEFRVQQAKEREDNYVKQKSKKKNPAEAQPPQAPKPPQPGLGGQGLAPAGAPEGAPRGDFANRGNGIDPQRRERLMRLFSQLSPEQQEQLLTRLEKARDENGGKLPPQALRRGKDGPQGPGERRPAPQPDDSMMPKNPGDAPVPVAEPQRQP